MHWVTKLGISFLAPIFGFAQSGPAISESTTAFRFQTSVKSFAKVDFGEFSLRVGRKSFRLHKGLFKQFVHGQGGVELELRNHWLIPTLPGKPEYAIVHFIHTAIGGSSSQTGFVQLLCIEGSHPVLRQELRFIPVDADSGCSYDPKTGELAIIAKSDDPSPDVSPKSVDHVLYRWNGNDLERIGWQTVSTKMP